MKQLIRKIYFLFVFHLFLKRKLKKTVTENIKGFKFKVYPSVFNPTDFFSSEIFTEFIISLGSLRSKLILDMGCGSGIVSVYCASTGAKCIAADINPEAVRAAKENALLNGFEDKIKVIGGNLFENIKDKFDIIFFNPPYYPKEPANNFEMAFNAGEGYRILKKFVSSSKEYLKNSGVIYMIISSDMDISEIKSIFSSNNFKFVIIKEYKKLLETFYITKAFA